MSLLVRRRVHHHARQRRRRARRESSAESWRPPRPAPAARAESPARCVSQSGSARRAHRCCHRCADQTRCGSVIIMSRPHDCPPAPARASGCSALLCPGARARRPRMPPASAVDAPTASRCAPSPEDSALPLLASAASQARPARPARTPDAHRDPGVARLGADIDQHLGSAHHQRRSARRELTGNVDVHHGRARDPGATS